MKRKRFVVAGLLLPLLVIFGWWDNQPQRFLKNSDKLILYSLKPHVYEELPSGGIVKSKSRDEIFEGNEVLGKVVITDPTEKTALVDTLFSSFNDGAAFCHFPRHGIRAIRGIRTMDLTVCFECENVYFYAYGQQFRETAMSGSAKELFNRTLRKHHLPLVKE